MWYKNSKTIIICSYLRLNLIVYYWNSYYLYFELNNKKWSSIKYVLAKTTFLDPPPVWSNIVHLKDTSPLPFSEIDPDRIVGNYAKTQYILRTE